MYMFARYVNIFMHKVKFTIHLYIQITIIKVTLISHIKSTHLRIVQVRPKEWGLVLLVIGGSCWVCFKCIHSRAMGKQ